jgi:hypothetical protein
VRRVGSELRASEASPFPVTRPSSLRPQNDGSSQEGSRQRTISSSSRQQEVIRQAAQEAVERHVGSSPPLAACPTRLAFADHDLSSFSRAQFSYGPSKVASGSRSAALPPPVGTSRGKGKRKADVVELDSDGNEVIDVDSSDDERPRLLTRVDKGKWKAAEKRSFKSAAGTFEPKVVDRGRC